MLVLFFTLLCGHLFEAQYRIVRHHFEISTVISSLYAVYFAYCVKRDFPLCSWIYRLNLPVQISKELLLTPSLFLFFCELLMQAYSSKAHAVFCPVFRWKGISSERIGFSNTAVVFGRSIFSGCRYHIAHLIICFINVLTAKAIYKITVEAILEGAR